jgi:hypothetical protein
MKQPTKSESFLRLLKDMNLKEEKTETLETYYLREIERLQKQLKPSRFRKESTVER